MKIAIWILSFVSIIFISLSIYLFINKGVDESLEVLVSNNYKSEDIEVIESDVLFTYHLISKQDLLVFIYENNTNKNQSIDFNVKYYDYEENLIKSETVYGGNILAGEESIAFSNIPILIDSYAGKVVVEPIITEYFESIRKDDYSVSVDVSKIEDFNAYEISTTVGNESDTMIDVSGYNLFFNKSELVYITNINLNDLRSLEELSVVDYIYPFSDNVNDLEYMVYDEVKTFINRVYYH